MHVSWAHVAKFYGRLRLIRRVFGSIEIFRIKLLEIVNLWVYYTIPFGFILFRHFRTTICNFWNHFIWLRISDKGSLPEMRIWSILLIKSDLKWCIHLSRGLFLYLKHISPWICVVYLFKWTIRRTCSIIIITPDADCFTAVNVNCFRR